MATSLPVIDVDRVDLESPRAPEIARAVDDAFRRTGFCYVANTGIEANLIGAVFDAARRFHALSDEAKQAIAITRSTADTSRRTRPRTEARASPG